MEVFLERCAGLDVHQASVVRCVLIGAPGRKPQKLLRTFGTTTRELEALRAWLAEHGVTHIGMESTGVYWKPVYAVLGGHFDLTVGNAHHIKNVPGRKADVKDAEWIAQLVRHGLAARSFVPPPAIRDLREMVRHRRTLIETRTAVRNRVLKLLEGANIKLSGVASDVFGVSGMTMLEALATGTNNAAEMAGLARGRMRRKHAELEAALDGRMREHECFLLGMHLRTLKAMTLARATSTKSPVSAPPPSWSSASATWDMTSCSSRKQRSPPACPFLVYFLSSSSDAGGEVRISLLFACSAAHQARSCRGSWPYQ